MKATSKMLAGLDPGTINPLADGAPEDTIRAVSNVLGFLTASISAAMEQDASTFDMADGSPIAPGLHAILSVCQAALDVHRAKGGAA